MPSRLYSSFINIGVLGIVAGTIFLIVSPRLDESPRSAIATTSAEVASVDQSLPVASSSPFSFIATTSVPLEATSSSTSSPAIVKVSKPVTAAPAKLASQSTAKPATASTTPQAVRIQDPYEFPPESFSTVNTAARGALVNILCMPRGGGSLEPISGSGVIIDPRGVILTNAHVAQYLLLSESPDIDLSCQIRTGAPATAQWSASVLYIPPVWVSEHVAEINISHPTGTGEHDYALLLITGSLGNSTLPAAFPYLPYDTRDAIGFLDDQVLGASYPAEFIGGMAAENDLYPVSSVSPISQLLTFGTSTVDVIALGGVIEAQSGSSGGAVSNMWGRLIGIISTTSDAPTTGGRDLRAITLSYINRDLLLETGSTLSTFLSGNLTAEAAAFNTTTAPGLLKQYIQVLSQ